MNRTGPRLICVGLLIVALSIACPVWAQEPASEESEPFTILIYTKTAGFRHGSIAKGVAAIQKLGGEFGFEVHTTDDAAVFTDDNLAYYAVVVFLNTTGDVLDEEQQAAFERRFRGAGGFVGVHSATDTEYEWSWYGKMIGTYFLDHPEIQQAALSIVEPKHLSTKTLPEEWSRIDEWYNFASPLGEKVKVLVALVEASYTGGSMGELHPISWMHEFEGGRAWYTGMGHTDESYEDPHFLKHLLGGIRWAARVKEPVETEPGGH